MAAGRRPLRAAAALLLLPLTALLAWPAGAAAHRRRSASERFDRAETAWTPASYPDPNVHVNSCGRRGVKSFICDPDGVLTYENANLAEGLIAQIERGEAPYVRAPCGDRGLRGFQVAVALMNRMAVPAGQDPADTAASFARALQNQWGVGSAACDNGVLLFLSVLDRQMYISTGAGAREAGLKRRVARAVLDNMKPALRDRRYGEAVVEALHEIGLAVAGKDVPGAPTGGGGGDGEGGGGGLLVFLAIVGGLIGWSTYSNRRQTRRIKTCQDKLEALKRDQAMLRQGQSYKCTSCPVCLEDFDEDGGRAPTSAAAGGVPGTGASAEVRQRKAEATPLLSRCSEAQAAASSAGGGPGGKPARRPLILRCGHCFCAPCISEWVRGHTTCPICRRDINAPDEPAAAADAPRREQQQQQSQARRAGGSGSGSASSSYDHPGGSFHDGVGRGDPFYDGRGPDPFWDHPRPGYGYGSPYGPRGSPFGLRSRRDVWMPELLFRAQRLRALYPDYVTDDVAAGLQRDITADRDISPAAVRAAFEARNPARDAARREELREDGRMGAHASFGGGRGDGGAGSSW